MCDNAIMIFEILVYANVNVANLVMLVNIYIMQTVNIEKR